MGFKPAEDKLVIELLDSYRSYGVVIPAATQHIVGVGRVVSLKQDDDDTIDFNPDYDVGDIVVFDRSSMLEIQIDKTQYFIIDKFDLFGKIESNHHENN